MDHPLSATTRLAAVIGDPIRHSLSPAIMNAAFQTAAIDWAFVAFAIPAGRAVPALEAARVLGIGGLSVTMPHKSDIAHAVDELTSVAAHLDAVNCVIFDGARAVGHNTDGAGFLAGVRDAVDNEAVVGRRCVVLGAGGAARAIVVALADAGAAEVCVVARSPESATHAASLAGSVGRVGDLAACGEADLVVNATPVGMAGDPGTPCDPTLLGPGQIVVDIVYEPLETPLLRAARAQGSTVVDGLGMLVHQAAVAIGAWTGVAAPVDAMREAALEALASRAGQHRSPSAPGERTTG